MKILIQDQIPMMEVKRVMRGWEDSSVDTAFAAQV